MIKFFRHIRQQLIQENKLGKYLKYAIGEIVLVVIGILIALAINNWNQNYNDRKLGNDLLIRISNDLVKDTLSFRNTIAKNNEIRNEIKELLNIIYAGVNTIDDVKRISKTFDLAMDQVFTTHSTTYESMLGSNTLALVHNEKLKASIVELYTYYDEVDQLLNDINAWMLNVTSTLDTKTNFIKFNDQVSDIFTQDIMVTTKDFAFLNNQDSEEFQILVRAVSATAFNQNVRNLYYVELINKCEIVLNQINNELN